MEIWIQMEIEAQVARAQIPPLHAFGVTSG
jgi:hypothetical protein